MEVKLETKKRVELWKLFLYSTLPVFFVLLPLLFFGKIFATGDALSWLYPFFNFYDRALAAGESFLWNPGSAGGFPSFVTITGGFFSPPVFLLVKMFSAFTAYNWLLFLNFTLVAFMTAVLLRAYGLSLAAQLIGAWAFVFSQWHWAYDLPLVSGFWLFPFAALAAKKIIVDKKYFWLVWSALACGYMFLSVHYNLIILILFFSLTIAFFESQEKSFKSTVKTLAVLGAVVAIGLGLGLMQIWSAATIIPFSARGELTFQQASVGALGLFDFVRLALPVFRPIITARSEALMFMGVLPLVFALLSAFRVKGRAKFYSWLAVIMLLVAVKYSPLFWLLNHLPVFSLLRSPSRWLTLGFFAASILAAYGLDNIVELMQSRSANFLKKFLMYLSGLAIVVSAGSAIAELFFKDTILARFEGFISGQASSSASGFGADYYQQVFTGYLENFFRITSLLSFPVLISMCFLVLSAGLLYQYRRSNFSKLAIILVGVNFSLVFFGFHPLVKGLELSSGSEVTDFLQGHQGKYLSILPGLSEYQLVTVPYGSDPSMILDFQKNILPPNFNLYFGLSSIDYYDNLMPESMANYLALLGSDRSTAPGKISDEDITVQEKIKKITENKYLFDLLGIRYVISAYPLDETVFNLVLKTEATSHNIPVMVYENPDARPEVYLASVAQVITGDDIEAVLSSKPTGRDIIVGCKSTCGETSGEAAGEVKILEKSNGNWKIKSTTVDQRWLVISENNLPGWQVTLDGQRVEPALVNGVYLGVFVPAGEHEVVAKYGLPFLSKI